MPAKGVGGLLICMKLKNVLLVDLRDPVRPCNSGFVLLTSYLYFVFIVLLPLVPPLFPFLPFAGGRYSQKLFCPGDRIQSPYVFCFFPLPFS